LSCVSELDAGEHCQWRRTMTARFNRAAKGAASMNRIRKIPKKKREKEDVNRPS
jgi:hypothetical protein